MFGSGLCLVPQFYSSPHHSPYALNLMEEIIEDLITCSYNDFSIVPCYWQLIISTQLLEQCDLVGTAATGDGKTLTFFLPLLHEPKKVVFIIALLKALADQHAASAKKLGSQLYH